MDIENLIKQYRQAADKWEKRHPVTDTFDLRVQDVLREAATALSTLQAENKRLNKIVCAIPTTPDSGRTISQYDKEMSMCAYLDDLEAENEKLRAELEKVKRERDAAQSLLAERIGVRGAEPITTAFGLPIDRLRELAQADREGRVKIEQKARRCPRCGKMTLFPRIDWQFYYCYSCKTQFSKSDFEAALRREQDD